MTEKIPTFETGPERIPTEAEVSAMFEKILDGREHTEIAKMVDETGVYVWDIATTDDDGDRIEYCYKRAGESETGKVAASTIEVAYFMGDDPVGGESLYKFRNGQWETTR